MIATPTYYWETRITHGVNVKVNEGPEVLVSPNGRLFITFSAGGCWSDDYCIGHLSLKDGGDPMRAADWSKNEKPVFAKNVVGGAFGPGHNGFFKSADGSEDWMIYHANTQSGQGCRDLRNPRMQAFTRREDGFPDLGIPLPLDTPIKKPSSRKVGTKTLY